MAKFAGLLSECEALLETAPRILIGYSGGMDSSVLLHAAAEVFPKKPILAIHINHQIHQDSDQWEAHCKDVAEELSVSFMSEKITISGDSGIEEQARGARYALFENCIEPNDILLTAHHADDQIETFLFRLFRGSGFKGLAAMPMVRPLGQGQLLRPLLKYSKQELKNIALQAELDWIEDSSNTDVQFDRNHIRNEIYPKILDRWQAADKQILSVVEQFGEADELFSDIADLDLEGCDERAESVGHSLDIALLTKLSRVRQDNLLRRFVYKHGGSQPKGQTLDLLRSELLEAAIEAQPLLRRGRIEMRRFNGRLYLLPKLPESEFVDGFEAEWPAGEQCLKLAGLWGIRRLDHLDQDFRVTNRKGGERAKPIGREHSQTLKKLLLEYKVEPWLRDWLPVVYSGNDIVAVGDRIQCSEFQFQMHWLIEQAD